MQLNDQSKFQSPPELPELAEMTGALTHSDVDEVLGETFCPHITFNQDKGQARKHVSVLSVSQVCPLTVEHRVVVNAPFDTRVDMHEHTNTCK